MRITWWSDDGVFVFCWFRLNMKCNSFFFSLSWQTGNNFPEENIHLSREEEVRPVKKIESNENCSRVMMMTVFFLDAKLEANHSVFAEILIPNRNRLHTLAQFFVILLLKRTIFLKKMIISHERSSCQVFRNPHICTLHRE